MNYYFLGIKSDMGLGEITDVVKQHSVIIDKRSSKNSPWSVQYELWADENGFRSIENEIFKSENITEFTFENLQNLNDDDLQYCKLFNDTVNHIEKIKEVLTQFMDSMINFQDSEQLLEDVVRPSNYEKTGFNYSDKSVIEIIQLDYCHDWNTEQLKTVIKTALELREAITKFPKQWVNFRKDQIPEWANDILEELWCIQHPKNR